MKNVREGEGNNMMFQDKNWEVIERESIGAYAVDVYLIYRDSKVSIAHVEDGLLVLSEIKGDGNEEKPTFHMPLDAWRALKSVMVDKKVKDIKEIDAELTATKYHLEDMRKIVFKDK